MSYRSRPPLPVERKLPRQIQFADIPVLPEDDRVKLERLTAAFKVLAKHPGVTMRKLRGLTVEFHDTFVTVRLDRQVEGSMSLSVSYEECDKELANGQVPSDEDDQVRSSPST
jgi:hypothetical protein